MKTRYISWDEALGYKKDELEYAAGVLREGGLVAFPTETVYGLGGNGLMKEASAVRWNISKTGKSCRS